MIPDIHIVQSYIFQQIDEYSQIIHHYLAIISMLQLISSCLGRSTVQYESQGIITQCGKDYRQALLGGFNLTQSVLNSFCQILLAKELLSRVSAKHRSVLQSCCDRPPPFVILFWSFTFFLESVILQSCQNRVLILEILGIAFGAIEPRIR